MKEKITFRFTLKSLCGRKQQHTVQKQAPKGKYVPLTHKKVTCSVHDFEPCEFVPVLWCMLTGSQCFGGMLLLEAHN